MMEDDGILTSATCNSCGRRLSRREFRACHSGHFCDKHRKPLVVQKPSNREPVAPITKGKQVKTAKDDVPQYPVLVPRTRPLPTDPTQADDNSLSGKGYDPRNTHKTDTAVLKELRAHLNGITVRSSPHGRAVQQLVAAHEASEQRQAIIDELLNRLIGHTAQNLYRMVTCIRGLATMRATEATSTLQALALAAPKPIRRAAEAALAEMDPDWVVSAALTRLHAPQSSIRYDTVKILTSLNLLEALAIRDRLVELAHDKRKDLRHAAACALARVGDERCLEVVTDCNQFNKPSHGGPIRRSKVRPVWSDGIAVCLALRLREGRHVDLLLRMAKHEDEQMRTAAADELWRFNTPAVREQLLAMTKDESDLVECAAMCALVWCGDTDERRTKRLIEWSTLHPDRRINVRASRCFQADVDPWTLT